MNQNITESRAIEWLVRLNSPDISEKQKNDFFAWMTSSVENQCAYIKAEQLWEQGFVFSELKEPESAFDFWLGQKQLIAMACSLAIIIICSIFYVMQENTTSAQFHTAIGERQDYSLEDGSLVTLNTLSDLRIELTEKHRIAYVDSGEVFFKVAKDTSRPFDVITPNGSVRVVGTQFSVHNRGNDTTVTVSEGKVTLGSLVIQANQRISMIEANAGETPKLVDAAASLAWRTNQLVYRSEPLETVVNDINRYFEEQITIADPDLKNKVVVAVIQLNTIKDAATVLASSLNLDIEYNQQQSTLVLHSKEVAE